MSPLVGEQFWKGESRQLSISTTLFSASANTRPPLLRATYKANESHGNNHRCVILRSSTDDETDEKNGVTARDEPAAAEEIGVGTADPERR